ncbi:LrgB family protein [Geoalkalibacter halelectricus]|uniref:LrgB family protein n=1 Tax=Geoalkalibacter halelectricus TaxID=2847045 RepID=A0ABY5ZH85_9BACT|nr:LrgB family protein [Geoalkalibacter halelectricus]MDO3376572.1 LrgB family protein [Geoalkalibacter halelectricus]UWZ78466.1 LrgB family protein [Geoalkalibacter halelectricus]
MFDELLNSPLFGVGLTLGVYALAQKIYQRTGSVFFNPVALTIATLIAFLVLLRIPYETYALGGQYILFLLGPSVVALAVPLYTRRKEILARKAPILIGIAAGAVASVLSACGLAWLLGGSTEVILSLSPKSVTTPIAIGIVEKIGGLPPLTAALVVLTGCLGAICGPEFCRLIGIRDPAAMGLAVGTASHGIGTARMLEVDRLGGAVSGLAIGLNGMITALVLPFLILLFL